MTTLDTKIFVEDSRGVLEDIQNALTADTPIRMISAANSLKTLYRNYTGREPAGSGLEHRFFCDASEEDMKDLREDVKNATQDSLNGFNNGSEVRALSGMRMLFARLSGFQSFQAEKILIQKLKVSGSSV